jgi:hypothetical protein
MASVGGDDRAEHERRRPGQWGDRVNDRADHERRHQDEAYREERDRPDVRPKVAPRSKYRRDVQQRRQEQQEYELGVELHLRQTRNQPEHRSPDDEQDRVGHLDPRGERGKRCHRHEKADDYLNLRQTRTSRPPTSPA